MREVFANQRSLNLQIVRQGSAAVYCKHLRDCAGSEPSYLSAENAAKPEKLGIWNSQQS